MPDMDTFAEIPWQPGHGDGLGPARHRGRARHLRRVHAERRAVRRRPARRAEAPAGRARRQAGLRLNAGPELEFFLFRQGRVRRDRAAAARPSRLLRLLDRPRRQTSARTWSTRSRRSASASRPPTTRSPSASTRSTSLRRRAADRRQRGHLQVHAEGDRAAARPLRHVHAQADPRHQRLGHAHAPVPVLDRRGAQRVRRPDATSTGCRTWRAATWPASWPTPAA